MTDENSKPKVIRQLYRQIRKRIHSLYLLDYHRASRKLGNLAKKREQLFSEFLEANKEKKCLQIGVKEDFGKKFGSNWLSVDLYDTRPFIDYNYDVHDLKFPDEEFDAAVCISILEHLPYPEQAIQELFRVLKRGGEIWVQLPFQYPYHEAPKDYWRASPDGLRIWMKDFEELACGSFLFSRSRLVTSTFFYGIKPHSIIR